MKDYQELETICEKADYKQAISNKKGYGFKTLAATLALLYGLLIAKPVQAGDLSIRPAQNKKEATAFEQYLNDINNSPLRQTKGLKEGIYLGPTSDLKGGMAVCTLKFGPGSSAEEGLAEKINEAYAGKGLSKGAKVLITTLIIGGIAYGIYAIVEHNQDKDDETPAPTQPEGPGPGGG